MHTKCCKCNECQNNQAWDCAATMLFFSRNRCENGVMVIKDKLQCLSSPLLFILLQFWLQMRTTTTKNKTKKTTPPHPKKKHRKSSAYRMKQLDSLQVMVFCGDQTLKEFTAKKFGTMVLVVQYHYMIILRYEVN